MLKFVRFSAGSFGLLLPVFDVTALRTALDNDEKALRGNFAEYYSWTSLGSNFTERLEGWEKADGELWHNEEAVKLIWKLWNLL